MNRASGISELETFLRIDISAFHAWNTGVVTPQHAVKGTGTDGQPTLSVLFTGHGLSVSHDKPADVLERVSFTILEGGKVQVTSAFENPEHAQLGGNKPPFSRTFDSAGEAIAHFKDTRAEGAPCAIASASILAGMVTKENIRLDWKCDMS